MESPSPSSAKVRGLGGVGDARLVIIDGVTYVAADDVRRWLELADRDLARKWTVDVDHMVRTGMERASRARPSWWPW